MSALDEKINEHFAGYVVRKDLVKAVKGNAIVPTYVLEYLLGQYCATTMRHRSRPASRPSKKSSESTTFTEAKRADPIHDQGKGPLQGHRPDQRRAERKNRQLRSHVRQLGHQKGCGG